MVTAPPVAGAAPAPVAVQSWWDYPVASFSDVSITPFAIAAALIALIGAWLISVLVRRAILRVSRGREGDEARQAAIYTVSRLVHYVVLAVGVVLALDALGFSAGRFAVIAGALGVGLGFGLQAIFNNFVSGLILLFDRSIKVGDFVELESGVHGEVRDIRIRATRIVTNDSIDILVPNSEFVSGRVVNWTHGDRSRRMRIAFSVAYGSDKEKVKSAAIEAASEVPFTFAVDGERRPQVWLSGFGDSSLDFELVVWLTPEATKRPSAVRAAYNWALESSLRRHALEIPFPQRDLRVRELFGLDGAAAREALGLKPPKSNVSIATMPPESVTDSGNDALEEVQREIDEARDAESAERGDNA
jgi:small-conductance mechanosensitive channel